MHEPESELPLLLPAFTAVLGGRGGDPVFLRWTLHTKLPSLYLWQFSVARDQGLGKGHG